MSAFDRKISPERVHEIKKLCEDKKETYLWASKIQYYELSLMFEYIFNSGIDAGMERAEKITLTTFPNNWLNEEGYKASLTIAAYIRKEISND